MKNFSSAHPYLTFLLALASLNALVVGVVAVLDVSKSDVARHDAPVDYLPESATSLQRDYATYYGGGIV